MDETTRTTPQPIRAAPTWPAQAALALISLLLAGAALLGAWHVGVFARHSAQALALPFPLDGLEGTLLHEAWLLRAGEPLYQPLQPDRFVSSPYPPLHYALLALVASPEGGPHVFFVGRVVSLAAMLVAALALALSAYWLGRSLPVAALAAALWLAFPPVQLWATRIKPDPLALALTALGLLAAIWWRAQTTGGRRQATMSLTNHVWLFVAAALFALAFFTKQTAVAAPLATGLALLLDALFALRARRLTLVDALRPALLFALAYGALIGAGWLGLELATGGQYTFHVWGLHRSEWWSAALLAKFVALLLPSWPLVAVGAGLLAYGLAQRAAAHPPLRLPACYLLAAPLTLLGAGETGANHNHLLEVHLALTLGGCALAGALVSGALRARRAGLAAALASLLALALLGQLWALRERPAWYGGEFDLSQTPARYVEFIRSQPGEVLADDVGLLVAAGRTLRYDDPSTMGPAIESGVWDEATLLQEVAARRFSAVLMPFDAERRDIDVTGRWSPRFIATLREHYRVLYRDTIVSYVPR
jgi:hypothetical protein